MIYISSAPYDFSIDPSMIHTFKDGDTIYHFISDTQPSIEDAQALADRLRDDGVGAPELTAQV